MKKKILSQLALSLTALSLVILSSCTSDKGKENVLKIPMVADAKTLDPAMVADRYSNWAVEPVYEGLVEYHYLKRPHELTPLLAESMPEVSKDGLTYTFKIKKGVRFSDHASFPEGKGRELKAKDFVYSFLRVADPKLTSEMFWVFDNRIVGLNEWREAQKSKPATDYDAPVAGFQALDDYTLQIKVKTKYPQLLYVLAMPCGAAVAREVVESSGKDFVNNPVGTGPYKLKEWVRNSVIRYERNPNWRGQTYPAEGEPGDAEVGLLADAGKPLPFADKLELHPFVESQPMWLNFMKGLLDFSTIPKDNYKTAIDESTKELSAELKKLNVRLTKYQEPDLIYFTFNLEDPTIKKLGPNFRKAVALALDNTKFIETFYNGRGVAAHGPIPPTIAGYDENFINPYSTQNIAKAKEYLAKAGYPDGKGLPEITYDNAQGTDSRQQAERLQKELAVIGIKIRPVQNQFSELLEKINKKKTQIHGIAWLADYPDAENFLQLLYGRNKAPGPNGANFDNAEYNKIYEQVRDMADSPERRQLIGKLNEIFVREMPWVVQLHRIGYNVSHRWLKNFKPGYMGAVGAKWMRVDTEERGKGL